MLAYAQRSGVLFAIAVLGSVAYFAFVSGMPMQIRGYLEVLPLMWIIPAVACCLLFAVAWRPQGLAPFARYWRIGAYGFAAPAVALALIAGLYTIVLGHNP